MRVPTINMGVPSLNLVCPDDLAVQGRTLVHLLLQVMIEWREDEERSSNVLKLLICRQFLHYRCSR